MLYETFTLSFSNLVKLHQLDSTLHHILVNIKKIKGRKNYIQYT